MAEGAGGVMIGVAIGAAVYFATKKLYDSAQSSANTTCQAKTAQVTTGISPMSYCPPTSMQKVLGILPYVTPAVGGYLFGGGGGVVGAIAGQALAFVLMGESF